VLKRDSMRDVLIDPLMNLDSYKKL